MKFTPRIPINFYRPAFCLWMVLVFAGFSPSLLMAQLGLAIDQQLIPVMTPADPGSPCTGNPIFPYYFGTSLAVSGPDLVVGSPFLFTNSGILDFASVFAYTFDSPNNQWQPTQVLCTDNLTDAFGWSVSVSEDLLVAGAPNTWGTLSFPSVGGIHTYRKNLSGDWDLVESLFGTASGDVYFGESVSVASGDGIGDHVLAVGTRDRPSSGGGGAQPPAAASQVWFYRHPATPSWTQWDLINAVSAPPGSSVITFGESVSVSKYTGGSECSGPTEIAIVGNPASNRAEVYLRFGSLFVHHQTISGPVGTPGFGNAVVVKEDTAVIGSQNGRGAVYRMDGYPSFLFQMEDQLIPAGGSGSPVTSVSLDGDIAALGVPGSVFLFYRNSQTGDWALQLEADVMGDSIGHSVAIQSGTLFTGAADPLNQSVWDGTAYIFSPTSDCNGNGIPDEIDIGNGLSLDNDSDGIPDECGDCNANGFPDYADLASGFSQDCNNNNFPDECDLWADCNSNGINDLCDISSGLSTDCNGNNSPDECESLDDCNNNGTPDLCDIAPGGTSSDIDNNNVPDDCQGCHFPTATSWEETQQLLGTTASERFGATLAMSENLMVVGSPLDSTQFSEAGSTEVYRLVNGSWQLEQALQSPTPQADERFGNSVDVFDDGSGGGLVVISTRPVLYGPSLVINVYVYRFDSSQSSPWVLEKVLTPATGVVSASPGSSVAVDRDYIAVGVPFGGPPTLSDYLGRVYVYRFDDLIPGQWTASANGPLFSGVIDDRFGTWVDIQISETPGGETDFVVVGAPAAACGNSGTDSGLAYIFKRFSTGGPGLPTDNLWSMESVVWPIDGQADSYKFGASVAISDDVIVVGAIQYPDGPGSAHIFRRDDSLNNWLPEQKLVASDGQPGDIFGRSVAISGNTVVVGAYGDTGSTPPPPSRNWQRLCLQIRTEQSI